MENWQKKIQDGMKLIIEGCKENENWTACKNCPFTDFCDAIYRYEEIPYSTPDTYEEEGLAFTL